MSALQHIPVQLSSDPVLLPSLIILPKNSDYWRHLSKSARKIRRCSILLVVNFAWAIVSALLTVVDTLYRPVPGEIGYGTVTSFAYLLPLVIGWIYVGTEPEFNHLRDSLEEARKLTFVATGDGDEPVLAENLAGRPKQAIEFVRRVHVDLARRDEAKTNPVYIYSRVFVWSQIAGVIYTLARNATTNMRQDHPVMY